VSDLTSFEILTITIVAVLAVVAVGLALLLIRRLRQRRAQLLHELTDRPDLVRDRAYNRLGMARREAELLSRQGADLGRARELIAQSQAAFDNRNFDKAYSSAQMAHEALVDARRTTRLPDPSPGRATPPLPTTGPPPLRTTGPTAPAATAPSMPRNRAESQFQLRLLDQEIAAAQRTNPREPSTIEATGLRGQAQAAFDRSDFTDAFRLALKGRRAVGSSVEALPPSPATRGGPSTSPAGNVGPAATDAAQTAETVAGGDRCPECGYPALPGDVFCRGCGTPRGPGTCPQCGTARAASDTFCGKCGAKFT
jgi:hypothetical protein